MFFGTSIRNSSQLGFIRRLISNRMPMSVNARMWKFQDVITRCTSIFTYWTKLNEQRLMQRDWESPAHLAFRLKSSKVLYSLQVNECLPAWYEEILLPSSCPDPLHFRQRHSKNITNVSRLTPHTVKSTTGLFEVVRNVHAMLRFYDVAIPSKLRSSDAQWQWEHAIVRLYDASTTVDERTFDGIRTLNVHNDYVASTKLWRTSFEASASLGVRTRVLARRKYGLITHVMRCKST